MTAALIISDPAPTTLSAVGARRLTNEIRAHLGGAIVKLQQARLGSAHTALGYDTWHDYCEHEFGDLRDLALPRAERVALVESMDDAGLKVRTIAQRLGVSVGTVQNDRTQLGKVMPLRRSQPVSYEGMTRADEVAARVAAQGERGLTCRELELETGWHHGVASGALSRLARQGRVRHDGHARQGYGVYVAG